MHGRKVIMEGQRLNQLVMTAEVVLNFTNQAIESSLTRLSSLSATVPRRAEGNILICPSELARFAVVIIAIFHDATVDLFD